MPSLFYTHGFRAALAELGLQKIASKPEMGDALYNTMTSVTGDEGRSRGRSHDDPADNAQTSFTEHDRHVLRDPHNEAHPFPVGAQQSRNEKRAVSLEELRASSDIPIREDDLAKYTGGAFYNRDSDGNPYIGYSGDLSIPYLAHELGHAEFDKSRLGRFTQHPIARSLFPAAMVAGLAAGAVAPSRWKIPASMLVGTLAGAPTLISEGVATYKGYQRLKELGADDAQLREYAKSMVMPSLSYIAGTTFAPASLTALGTLVDKLPKTAGHKLSRRTTFRGLDISIENDTGERRDWYDPHADRHGHTIMKYPYGYIRKTEGMDGDHVDCYLGPDEQAPNVYVITTNKAPKFTQEDEQKCMLGFKSAKEAKDAFLAHFDNPKFFRKMKSLPFEDFKAQALRSRDASDKKIASNMYESDYERPRGTGPGPTHNAVPGDFLGLPQSRNTGQVHIVGSNAEEPATRIDRLFKYHDADTDSRTIEGTDGNLPSGPTV